MQLVDRIEKRRFVGREFLLWLWFESEVLDGTLATRKHGSFGLWLENRLTLSAGKESTRIAAALPGTTGQAKQALLSGQLPALAGVRIALQDDETSFVLKAEQLGVAGLKLQTALDKVEPVEKGSLVEEMQGRGGKPKHNTRRSADDDDETRELFYERMRLTQHFEALLEALYADFIALRLSDVWQAQVQPLLQAWAQGQTVDAEAYSALKRARHKPGRGQVDSVAAEANG